MAPCSLINCNDISFATLDAYLQQMHIKDNDVCKITHVMNMTDSVPYLLILHNKILNACV